MNIKRQFIWLFFTLILLACSCWHYMHSSEIIRLDKDTLANSIDATASQVKIRQFDAEGSLVNLLISPMMQHIQKDDVYLLQSPHIRISQEQQPPWVIDSKNAQSFEGGKRITFKGNVVVRQKNKDKAQESTLKTEEVTYFPKEKKASTDLLVTYEQPGNVIQSKGMNAYLNEKRVELLHQARGSYVPENG